MAANDSKMNKLLLWILPLLVLPALVIMLARHHDALDSEKLSQAIEKELPSGPPAGLSIFIRISSALSRLRVGTAGASSE